MAFGWQDPRTLYGSPKFTEYHALPMDGWKFWKWRVVTWCNIVVNPSHETIADNLTREQAEGMVKLMEGIRDENCARHTE
jgi:hypothetical protein